MNNTVPNPNMPLNSCQPLPLNAFKIETPATAAGGKYALLPARAVTELSAPAVKMLGIFASLERPSGPLSLTATERLRATGLSRSGFYRARTELIDTGWMTPAYDLCGQMKPKVVAKSGWYARVQVDRWSVLPPRICRALAGVALYTMKDGTGRGSYRIVARFLRISTRSLRRHLAGARALGLKVVRFVRFKAGRAVGLRLKDIVPRPVRRAVPPASASLIKAGNPSEGRAIRLRKNSTRRDPRREQQRLRAWASAQGMPLPL